LLAQSSDQVVQAKTGNAPDFLQAGAEFFFRGMREPLFHLGDYLRTRQSAHRDDDGNKNLSRYAHSTPEGCKLIRRAAIQAGPRLLTAR